MRETLFVEPTIDPATAAQAAAENRPQLGNIANRVDILNATIGTVMQFRNSASLAAGYVAPLSRGETNRFFDGEFNLQFNYYFGGSIPQPYISPNF